uniref:GFA family protein n=1 Tax=Ningiella ruwaisensis TaxID=2364274 RepID=UPI0010A06BC0|nr:aldehyde-activating protein [Ningiella ruwaisensis]
MISYTGACLCNQVELHVHLPQVLSNYAPRACDCDFCRQNELTYISDPEGKIQIQSSISLRHERQGSNQAEFLSCRHCEQTVAVMLHLDERRIGAVNAQCLHSAEQFKEPIFVSPKTFSAQEKTKRWEQLWSPLTLNEPD